MNHHGGGFTALLRIELSQLFATPIAYALVAVYWVASGFFLFFNVVFVPAGHLVTAYHNMSLLLLLLLPLLTMRSFAEERRSGTLELLLALPLSETAIVAAKFVAAELLLLLLLLGNGATAAPLLLYGQPAWGALCGGTMGLFTLGSALIAVGVFLSSLSDNQAVAAALSWAVLLLLWFAHYPAEIADHPAAVRALRQLSLSLHSAELNRGSLSLATVAYMGSLVAVALCAAGQGLRLRRL